MKAAYDNHYLAHVSKKVLREAVPIAWRTYKPFASFLITPVTCNLLPQSLFGYWVFDSGNCRNYTKDRYKSCGAARPHSFT